MKKVIYIFMLMFTISICPLYSQDSVVMDEEDKGVQDDLYLSDTAFFKKYVDKLASNDPQYLNKLYKKTDDPEIKIYILKVLSEKGLNDSYVFEIFNQAVQEGVVNLNYYNKTLSSDTWRVRAAASYLIHEKPDGLDAEQKLMIVRALVFVMKNDHEERCRGMAALALGKLFSKADSKEAVATGYGRYDLLRKDVIVEILNTRLDKISRNDQFFCWTLVKSLGYLRSPKSFVTLLNTRRKGFNDKVKLEISRSVRAIVGEGSTRPASN